MPLPNQILPIVTHDIAAEKVWVENRMVYLLLSDGRVVGFPADRYKRLNAATDAQLQGVILRRRGEALRWEELDEDLTVAGILRGEFELPLEKQP